MVLWYTIYHIPVKPSEDEDSKGSWLKKYLFKNLNHKIPKHLQEHLNMRIVCYGLKNKGSSKVLGLDILRTICIWCRTFTFCADYEVV